MPEAAKTTKPGLEKLVRSYALEALSAAIHWPTPASEMARQAVHWGRFPFPGPMSEVLRDRLAASLGSNFAIEGELGELEGMIPSGLNALLRGDSGEFRVHLEALDRARTNEMSITVADG